MQLCTLTMLIGGCAVTAAQIDERNVAGSPDTNSIPTSQSLSHLFPVHAIT